ncbi:hypothetical protein R3P38DRAFT_3452984 [Favolaschia claudopus]|uniref:F-box domain-containing protein n=1 Tax=Favolaschia claudopus TaxID=2862362 RepID=A0AAW0CQJ8_9AGAR
MAKKLSPTRVRKRPRKNPSTSGHPSTSNSPPELPVFATPQASAATSFFALSELVMYHLLDACTISTVMALSHTSSYFRSLVKALFRVRITSVLEHFLGHLNVGNFFSLLEETDAAIGGSAVARVLVPPVIGAWMPENLNLYVPKGRVQDWEGFMDLVEYAAIVKQPGVDKRYAYATASHTVYESKTTPLLAGTLHRHIRKRR